jgi:3-keto-disaccharide hydrolase
MMAVAFVILGRRAVQATLVLVAASWTGFVASRAEQTDRSWRSLPLITEGKVDPSWTHIGWGGFVVDGTTLRTEVDEKGMGLLLYRKERFGNCQIRVVYKTKDSKSNSGVFVRIDQGILQKLRENSPAVRRNPDGKLSQSALQQLMDASEREQGAWYPVHHGYEVQILDDSDEFHCTGAIYSLAKAAPVPNAKPTDWKTMVITLKGNLVLVDIDGKRVTTFDPDSQDVPRERKWFEPKREPRRPASGYIGLQNHDPGDVVYFKEVSVRPLEEAP